MLLTILSQPAVYAQQAYWQQQVNYTIDVSLNDVEHTLDAFEKMEYINNSPDTLFYIWFHIWPNAYKNDQTAFSEQMLLNNRTDFYFSGREQKGYINRLDFKVDGSTAKMEDDSAHIDIIKIILPKPLPPSQTVVITTPFHIQLPYNFSRGGHVKQAYQVTQWYPKPAVFDRKGWHPMPYLDQGEFYSEFGNYDVRITVPGNYVVAATGILQNEDEIKWLKDKAGLQLPAAEPAVSQKSRQKSKGRILNQPMPDFPVSLTRTKTLLYIQNNVHDFAWFADKRFIVNYDTLRLVSGRVINAYTYYLPQDAQTWKNSIRDVKNAVLARSSLLGEYPFDVVGAVEAPLGFPGGMEYPTITSISPVNSAKELDETISHEVGHNWLYGILATNERRYPWMDEGMNTYYDARYKEYNRRAAAANPVQGLHWLRLPQDRENLVLETLVSIKKDQPLSTSSEKFSALNYELIAYYKAGEWMKQLEHLLGRPLFDSCMREYYRQWQFKHPYPEDFKQVIESVSGKNLGIQFNLLDTTGSLLPPVKKTIRVVPFFKLADTHANRYISLAPAIGANAYDGLMIGALVHNYQLPFNRLSFFASPMFGTASRKINVLAKVSYSWCPALAFYRIDAGMNAARFSMNAFQPEGMKKLYPGFLKLVPFIRVTLDNRDPLSKTERYLQFKVFFINEDQLSFTQSIINNDTSSLVKLVSQNTLINQLKFVIRNARVLYPYRTELQIEENRDFIRTAFTGNYYFNYSNRQGGMDLRLFAGKFMYTGVKSSTRQLNTDRYHLNLSGANGYEDYTYSDYFAGRNKFQNWPSQQIMIRDGAFKVRTDLLSSKIGKTDNWLAAVNLATDIPKKINPLQVLPFRLPVKLFADIGTYADAWDKDEETSRFLFDAGFQLLLFKERLNIYIPIVYSSEFRNYFRSTLGEKRFLKTISFSLDIHQFDLKKLNGYFQ